MNVKLIHTGILAFMMILGLGFNSLFAQFEEMPEDIGADEEEVKCKPDSFNSTPYEKFKQDTIEQKQIQIWYSFGLEEYKHEQWKRAIPYYWKVLVNDKTGTYKIVYSKLANCYFELTKAENEDQAAYLDSTMLVIYRGLDKYPEYATLHFRAGSIHRSLGQPECAIPHYEALVKDDPTQKSYLKILAGLYFQIGDEKALEVQQKLIELDPDNAEERNVLVEMIKYFGGDPLQVMREAFLNDTTDVTSAFRYGKEALLVGDYKAALRAFNALLAQQPNHIEAMEQKAKCLEGLDRNSDAIATYKEILKLNPKNVDVLCALASAYLRLNNFTTARYYVNQAKRIDPDFGEPYMVMAEIYVSAAEYCSDRREKKDYTYDDKLVFEMAVEEYRKAQRDPNYASTASSRMKGLQPFVRTKEDKFMVGRENIKDSCYDWISQ